MRTVEWVNAIEQRLLEVLTLAGVQGDPNRVREIRSLAALARRAVATGRVQEQAAVVRKALELAGAVKDEGPVNSAVEQLVSWAHAGALLVSCEHRTAQLGCRACVERVRRDIHEFPLQEDSAPTGPRSIPWAVADRAYPAYVQDGGRGQSLERLAERGGFGWGEMDRYFPGWRQATDEWVKLRARVVALEKARDELRAEINRWESATGVLTPLDAGTLVETLRAQVDALSGERRRREGLERAVELISGRMAVLHGAWPATALASEEAARQYVLGVLSEAEPSKP